MPSVLITGANRGIGLEFARQYAADGWDVIATARHSSPELDALGLTVKSLDLADPDAVATFTVDRPLGPCPRTGSTTSWSAYLRIGRLLQVETRSARRWTIRVDSIQASVVVACTGSSVRASVAMRARISCACSACSYHAAERRRI